MSRYTPFNPVADYNIKVQQAKTFLGFSPTADVAEVKHGEWGFDGLGWTCSECGEYAFHSKTKVQVRSKYCPNCGAKMDGERKDV